MLSGVSLKVALYALLRFHILTTACLGSGFSRTILLVFGLGSMCLAAPFILVQTDLKRLLSVFEPGACRSDLRRVRPERR